MPCQLATKCCYLAVIAWQSVSICAELQMLFTLRVLWLCILHVVNIHILPLQFILYSYSMHVKMCCAHTLLIIMKIYSYLAQYCSLHVKGKQRSHFFFKFVSLMLVDRLFHDQPQRWKWKEGLKNKDWWGREENGDKTGHWEIIVHLPQVFLLHL